MRGCWTLGLAVLIAFAALPAHAETVLGSLDGPIGPATGALPLTGWALADSGVRRVVIQVDGVDVGSVVYGLPRPAVGATYPGFPNSVNGGFGYQLNTTVFTNGVHHVSMMVITEAGTIRETDRHTVQFNNNTHNLVPFGRINRPDRAAELFGKCDDSDNPLRRYSIVSGWALDLGTEIGNSGIGYIELLLDGVIIANTRTDCRFDPVAGLLVDCYGFPRLDIENRFPFAIDAPNAGFRFGVDVGWLVDIGRRTRGHHTLTIRAGDISGQVSNIDEFPVVFMCTDDYGNEPSFGEIETPKDDVRRAGIMKFEGWALDDEEVNRVELHIDGIYFRNIFYGVDARTEVALLYPGYPDTAAPAWRAFFDTNQLSDGDHQAQIIVVDETGDATIIGEVTFSVDNVLD